MKNFTDPGITELITKIKGALNLKANIASPALTGTPTAPTAAVGTNTTQVATTSYTTSAINAKINPQDIAANTDLDTIVLIGYYKYETGGICTNSPVSGAFEMEVRWINSSYFHQILRGYDGNRVYIRVYANGVYRVWRTYTPSPYGNVYYGTCSTAAATDAKVVLATDFFPVTGSEITVKWTVTNTASSPTLNVNGTGAKPIFYHGSAIPSNYLIANRVYKLSYDGTVWNIIGDIVV